MPLIIAFFRPLAGGVLIGLAAGGLYLLAGEIAGITGIVRTAIKGPARAWRSAFVGGLLVAGLIANLIETPAMTAGLTGLSHTTIALAGLLVGTGTTIGSGCTSGHGVCGLSRLSPRSFAAVGTFMLTAGITVFLTRHGGLR